MWIFGKKPQEHASGEDAQVPFSAHEEELDSLLLRIRALCGIDLQIKRETIRPKLIKFCQQQGIASFAALEQQIILRAAVRQELYDLITVCETYFYRELKQLQELIFLLRSRASARRILCAPCSSGEEVYSILMLAANAGIKDIQITGIDINDQIIEKARAGVYTKRSLHNLDAHLIRQFFDEKDGEYHIKKHALSPAVFKVVNVFDREFSALGLFDVIFSRNMMIYFDEEYRYKLVDNFYQQLHPGGLFFAGHADLVPVHDGFKKVYSAATSYYEKQL